MISTIRYPALKKLNPGRGKSHLMILLIALVVASIYFFSELSLMAIVLSYVLSGPFLKLYQFARRRTGRERQKSDRLTAES